MSIEKRKTRKFRKKLFWIFLYLLFLVFLIVFFYLYNYFNKPLLLNPIQGKIINKTDLERQLKNAKISFSSISLESDSVFVIMLSSGGQIKLSSKKGIDKQISSLQRILRELTIDGMSFKSIDFRFEKPVVEFE